MGGSLATIASFCDGADLQQYICAINWMRASIPGYNILVQPLAELLERVFAQTGEKRTRQMAAIVVLADVGWGDNHARCLEDTKKAFF